jgi:hypothetical protein
MTIPVFSGAGGGSRRLGKVVLGSAAATIAFTAIPQNYDALSVVVMARGDDAAQSNVNLLLRFADTGTSYDTGANYDYVGMNGTGAALANVEGIGATSIIVGGISAALAPAGAVGISEILIPEYAGSTFHKTCVARGGRKHAESSANLRVNNAAGFWRDTSPIVALELSLASGNFAAGSVATLYGWR